MFNRPYIAAALLAALTFVPAAPAHADGEIQITHAKANAGGVTPGDAPGYPVSITIPGAFELASNLFVAANKIGIQVTHKNVTIDLNGFSMQGSNVAWYGVTGGANNVTIRNGTIDSFKFDGINGAGQNWTIEGLSVVQNGRDGIFGGGRWVVERAQVLDNGRRGVHLFEGGTHNRVHDSTVAGNAFTGIECGYCTVSGNVVADNGNAGIYGNVAVIGNYIVGNGSFGLLASTPSSGFAQNVLFGNNTGAAGDQVIGPLPLHPNICVGVAC